MKETSGIFLLRKKDNKILICHPTKQNNDQWSIPKGKPEEGEDRLDAAIRETKEETNIDVPKSGLILHALSPTIYKNKKKILHAFLIFEKGNESILNLNDVDIKCNEYINIKEKSIPEMDDFKWVDLDEAKNYIHEAQARLIRNIKEFRSL